MIKKLFISVILSTYLFAGSYDNGIDYYKQGKYKKAMDSFLVASNNDDNRAMFALGIIYANGDGVKKDEAKSLIWYEKAAINGNSYAYTKLGNIYASKEDYKNAFKWFKKAADKGDAKAAYNLGYFFTGGLGVDMNLKMALIWYEQAAKAGNIDAQLNIGFMYIGGQGTKVDYKKAAYWIKKAKDTGNDKATLMWEQFKLKDYEN
jgi:uncharacterized protein